MPWQRMQVELKGEPEPVVVQTTAQDWRRIRMDMGDSPIDALWQALHAALLREGASVPDDYEGFLEVLGGMPEVLDDGDPAPLDPTNAAP